MNEGTGAETMSGIDDRLIDRINKLLALGQDVRGNEHERDNAMRAVHALLLKHNLTIAQVERANHEPEEERGTLGLEGENTKPCANHSGGGGQVVPVQVGLSSARKPLPVSATTPSAGPVIRQRPQP